MLSKSFFFSSVCVLTNAGHESSESINTEAHAPGFYAAAKLLLFLRDCMLYRQAVFSLPHFFHLVKIKSARIDRALSKKLKERQGEHRENVRLHSLLQRFYTLVTFLTHFQLCRRMPTGIAL